MLCEICGEKKAVETIEMDGIKLRVCMFCTKFGHPIFKAESNRQTKPILREELDILPDYSKRIKDALKIKNISVRELAEKLMEKQSTLEKVEKGKMLPNKKLAKKLEKFLEITLTGSVVAPGSLQKAHPVATLGDIAEVRVKK